MHSAALVVAHASVLTEGLAEHATVIFPAESHAEKEGTLVHPDGRLQRQRIAIAHAGEVRPGWWVLTEIAAACGLDTGVQRAGDAFAQLVAAVPFYEGLTLEEIGGHGVRWPERPQAQSMALSADGPPDAGSRPPGGGRGCRDRRLVQRASAPGDLPADLGGPRVRDLAGAEVPHPRAAGRALAR